MFEKIFLKRNGVDNKEMDIGKIAECCLFYQSTEILVDKFLVGELCKKIDIGLLKEYSAESLLKVQIRKNAISIANFDTKIGTTYAPIIAASDAFNLSENLYKTFYELTSSKSKAKAAKRDFLDIADDFKYSPDLKNKLVEEWKDTEFLSKTLRRYINSYLPQLDTSEFICEITDEFKYNNIFDSYKIECNKNLEELSKKYSELLPEDFSFSIQSALLRLAETSGDIDIATTRNSEIYTDVRNEIYFQDKFSELIQKVSNNQEEIEVFQEHILKKYKPIGDTLRSGEKSFTEYSEILKKAQDFKGWLNDLDNDDKLLAAYYEEVTKETWIDKKPVKTARYIAFNGLAILLSVLAGGVPIGGLVSSAIDKYLLTKLVEKWRPNQFIDGEVKPFLPKKKNKSKNTDEQVKA